MYETEQFSLFQSAAVKDALPLLCYKHDNIHVRKVKIYAAYFL